MKSLNLWLSYVGKNAPSNALGKRWGLGRTKTEALEAAGHYANQAPFARYRRVTLDDSGASPLALDERDDARLVVDEITAWADSPNPLHVERARAAKELCDRGLYASAWQALHPAPTGRPVKGTERGTSTRVSVRLTEAERTTAEDLAGARGLSLSEWTAQRITTTGAAT